MDDEVTELLHQAVAALGQEPQAGEPMYEVHRRSLYAERLAVRALIKTVRMLHERITDASMLP